MVVVVLGDSLAADMEGLASSAADAALGLSPASVAVAAPVTSCKEEIALERCGRCGLNYEVYLVVLVVLPCMDCVNWPTPRRRRRHCGKFTLHTVRTFGRHLSTDTSKEVSCVEAEIFALAQPSEWLGESVDVVANDESSSVAVAVAVAHA